jgi:predicted RNase H-like HicB family nuclease
MSSILIYDHGWFTSLAERLARDGNRVGYFSPWQDGHLPDGQELIVGYGLDGVERIKYFHKARHDFDTIVFPDVWNADLQEDLRDQGCNVWGSGWGSSLELERWKTHQLLGELGLPRNDVVRVSGIAALRDYLKDHERVWIKISTLRGLDETWFSENYTLSEAKLNDIACRYGVLAPMMDYLVEPDLPDAIEVGYDGYCVDGQFPDVAILGVEKKDQTYACEVKGYDELPEEVRAVNDGLSKTLGEAHYRNWFSTEIRDDKLIDVTARHASPAGETYCELIRNLSSVIEAGARGQLLEPEIEDTFGCQILLRSEWAEKHPLAVQFPDEIRPFVKLYHHCRVDGLDWVIPQGLKDMKEIGSVVATGSTMEEAKELCQERARQVHAMKLESCEDSLDEAIEEVASL